MSLPTLLHRTTLQHLICSYESQKCPSLLSQWLIPVPIFLDLSAAFNSDTSPLPQHRHFMHYFHLASRCCAHLVFLSCLRNTLLSLCWFIPTFQLLECPGLSFRSFFSTYICMISCSSLVLNTCTVPKYLSPVWIFLLNLRL